MLDPHTSAAIAQTVFYVPIVPLSIYVVVRNWRNRPRQAWLPLVGFSLLRLIGGPLVIAIPHDPTNLGLIITAIIFLNVGVFPLLVTTLGLLRIILSSGDWKANRIYLLIKIIRITIVVQVALITAGGSLTAGANTADTGRTLGKVAYFLMIWVLGLMSYLVIRLNMARDVLSASDRKYLLGAAVSIPLIAVRSAYGILQQFNYQLTATWNPLFGSAVAFTVMALLPEYILLLVDLWLGFHRIKSCEEEARKGDSDAARKHVVGQDC